MAHDKAFLTIVPAKECCFLEKQGNSEKQHGGCFVNAYGAMLHTCTTSGHPLSDVRPWLNDPTHVLLVMRVSWRTGFAPLVPGSSSLSLLPCVEGASAGVVG
eukprot:scaffold1495_cov362-Pavlova_lutheri.AAC.7